MVITPYYWTDAALAVAFDAKIKMATFLRLLQRFWCLKMWYGAILNSDANVSYISYEC
jgi:hypothetical protein